jgi:hypothetical protein
MIALSVPSLWSSYFPPSQSGVLVFLERSRNAHINIKLREGRRHKIIDRWALFRPALGRTRELSLETQSRTATGRMRESLIEILNNIPERIETLKIDFHSMDVNKGTWTTPFHQLPQGSHPFPHLQRFACRNFDFNWKCGLMKNLHTLIIRNDSSLEISPGQLELLLDTIEACPLIQHLELVPSGTHETSRASFPSRVSYVRTPLACLRTIGLSTSLGGAFLARFALPMAAKMEVYAMIKNEFGAEDIVVLNAISDILNRSGYPVVKLDISIINSCLDINAKIQLSAVPLNTLAKGKIRIKVFYGPGTGVDTYATMNSILKTEASHMTKLACHFGFPSYTPPSFWSRIFMKTPYIDYLSLTDSSHGVLEGALLALMPDFHEEQPSIWTDDSQAAISGEVEDNYVQTEPPLPGLRELVLGNVSLQAKPEVHLRHAVGAAWLQYRFSYERRLSYWLMSCLHMRARRGCELDRIQLPCFFQNQDPFGGMGIAEGHGRWRRRGELST